MATNKTGPSLRLMWKARKFFVVFFIIIGVSFLSFEYGMSYFIVNGISLYTPLNPQREYTYSCVGLRCTPIGELSYCLNVPIVSQAVPKDIATGLFGLSSVSVSARNFSLVVNSYPLDPLTLLGFCDGIGIPAPAYAWQFWAVEFATSNRTIINALNNTISSMTLTMKANMRTNFYSQQITRSTTLDCNFGPIVAWSPTCGK